MKQTLATVHPNEIVASPPPLKKVNQILGHSYCKNLGLMFLNGGLPFQYTIS